jgi:hypothetical protein
MKKHPLHILFILFTVNAVTQNGKTITASTKTEFLKALKTMWQKEFLSKAGDMFTYLGDAKIQQLFGMNNAFNIDSYSTFQTLLSNNTQFRNNALKFIKVE